MIAISFLGVILIGAGLLTLPIASVSGESTPFFTALFTAFSATTTTGLTLVDTGSYYSMFGHTVILFMMQIGGLGFITYLGFFTLVLHGKISLHESNLMMQAAGIVRRDSVMRLLRRILFVTVIVEGIGTVLLCFRFVPQFGFGYGLYFSFFHIVSAFTNSGFDLGGVVGSASLSLFGNDALVLLTIAFVGLAGGLGFLVWDDFSKHRFRIRSYSLHSKIALATTGIVLTLAYLFTLLFEWNTSLAGMPIGQKFLCGFFSAATPLTSGYYALKPTLYSAGGLMLAQILMLIGGSPGSTAGGIKTTTIAVLALSTVADTRHKRDVVVFKRKISPDVIRLSASIFFYFVFLTIVSVGVMAGVEQAPFTYLLTDVVAAITTDGLSTGITSTLTPLSQIILMILMLIGRIGSLALFWIVAEGNGRENGCERPTEDILVG